MRHSVYAPSWRVSSLALLLAALVPASASAQDPYAALAGAAAPAIDGAGCGSLAPADPAGLGATLEAHRAAVPDVGLVAKKVEIPIVFTIFYDSNFPVAAYEAWRQTWPAIARDIYPNVTDGRLVTEESVRIAIDQLNDFYGRHHITFRLSDAVPDPVRWVEDPALFFISIANEDPEWERALRRYLVAAHGVDYPNALNVFVHMNAELGFVGLGAFPTDLDNPDFPWAISVDFRRMPGVPGRLDPGPKAKDYRDLDAVHPAQLAYAQYNATLAHEVGHCLGLLHTFTFSTASYGGDLVSDTPMEAVPFSGDGIMRNAYFEPFPLGRNTADDAWYWPSHKDPPDPVRNVMDYGAFHLRETELTAGQVDNALREIAMFAPQFVIHGKPDKPTKDRLLIYASFDDDDLTDGKAINQARHGKKVPLYVMEVAPGAGAAALVEAGAGKVLQLGGAVELRAMEDDLAGPDVRAAETASTIAFWLNLDGPAAHPIIDGLPFSAGFTVGAYGGPPALYFDVIPYLPWAPQVAVVRWQVTDTAGTAHLYFLELPAAILTDTWTHFAFVYDAVAGPTFYLNGTGLHVPEAAHGPTEPWTFFRVGLTWFDAPDPVPVGLNGRIDDLVVYNFGLGGAEVVDLLFSAPPNIWLKGNYQVHPSLPTAASAPLVGATAP